MLYSIEFIKSILDTVTEHIVVIDAAGDIQYVNRSWVKFGEANDCLIESHWRGVNYLDVCEDSAAMGDSFGRMAADGIRDAIDSGKGMFYLEYPCHSPDEKRWFMMRLTPFQMEESCYYVISHQNITERKLAEDKVAALSRIDGLTNIPNRRAFDDFLDSEWRRCLRLNMPVTLAIIDLDNFKLLNDRYGHQAGDECLRKVAALLKRFAKRPGDICARYGGEEFVIVHGNTPAEHSLQSFQGLLDAIRELGIPNEESPTLPVMTASMGVATINPTQDDEIEKLIELADARLYEAKQNGRNQLVAEETPDWSNNSQVAALRR